MADATQMKIGAGTQGAQGGSAAAGLGTRFLPATKAQPKEMLTVVDKPQIQDVVEECVVSGIAHIITRDRQGKKFHRRSLRPFADAGTLPGSKGEERASRDGAAHQRHGTGELHRGSKEPLWPGTRGAGGKRFGGRRAVRGLLGDVLIPGGNPATKQTH